MRMISEEQYTDTMEQIVLPYLEERRRSGEFTGEADARLYYEHFETENAKGILIMVHGFSEEIGKLYETAYYFLEEGYDVWMLQQREHGR